MDPGKPSNQPNAEVECTNNQIHLSGNRVTRIPVYTKSVTEEREREKQPLASRPQRTTGKHHKKGDHLCCKWTDESGE